MRAALGATRWRLARQLLDREHRPGRAGGAVGVGLAYGAIAVLARFGPADMPRLQMIAVNAQVLALCAGGDVLSALLFGFAPALAPGATGVGRRPEGRQAALAGSSHQRHAARSLAAAEVALAFVLVVSSGCCCAASCR